MKPFFLTCNMHSCLTEELMGMVGLLITQRCSPAVMVDVLCTHVMLVSVS